jgi:molybdate transport system ATP-binding protein
MITPRKRLAQNAPRFRGGPEKLVSRGIHGRIGVDRPQFALDLALDVAPGEVLAVLGPNGAGKSTLLRALAGLTPLTGGYVRVGDEVYDDVAAGRFVAPERRRLGVVFQDYRLFAQFSVVDNIAFGPRCAGVSRPQSRALAQELVDRLRLAEVATAKPATLSGGQAQRVALARALAVDPVALLLDEPLAALDAQTRLDVRAVLRERLHAFAGPTVLVTHDPLDALLLADRLMVIEKGRVRQTGSPAEVAARPETEYTARLMGVNLYAGEASDGRLRLPSGAELALADTTLRGPALAMVRPNAITVHTAAPDPSSARNAWPAVLSRISQLGDRIRLDTHGPLDAAVDVTPAAVAELGLAERQRVWLTAKATEVEAYRRSGPDH